MSNDWSTPQGAASNGWKWFWIAGTSLTVMIGIVILIGWQIAGWFGQANANRGYNQMVHGQGYQVAQANLMQQHLKNIGDLAVTRAGTPANSPEQQVMRAQQLNELQAFCSESLQLTAVNPATTALDAKAAANCDAGVPITNPPLADPVPAGQ